MKKVLKFHEAAGLVVDEEYSLELMNFRLKLIFEEIQEVATAALDIEDAPCKEEQIILLEKFLKELCDLVYVIKGTAIAFGMDFDQAYTLVHKSNMTKLPFTLDDNGKVKKGSNYKPPDLEGLV